MAEAGIVKEFYCEECGEFTKHVSISDSEYNKLTSRGDGPIMKTLGVVAGAVSDLTSAVNPAKDKLVDIPYVCKKCLKMSLRR